MRAGVRHPDAEGRPRWVAVVDGVLDGSLVAFALWTLWYELALWGQWSLWWAARVWVLVALGVIVICVRRELTFGSPRVSEDVPAAPGGPEADPRARRRIIFLAGSVVLLLVLVVLRDRLGVTPLALVGIVVLLQGLRLAGTRAQPRADLALPTFGRWTHALVAASCLGLGVLASFLLKPDADDAFYINRATWVAQHGNPALKDTMFSPGTLPSAYIGGLPLPSIEALQGSLAQALGVSAPTFAYVLSVPVLAAACGWATWRLVREWAPSHAGLVYGVAVAFALFSAHSVVGNYYVGRIWQGKVIALAIVLPLVWQHLGRLASRPARWNQTMLFVCGVCFVGLTTTAALLGPVIAAGVFVAAALLRSRALAVGGGLFLAAPLVAGLVAAFGPAAIGGADPVAMPASEAFSIMVGTATPMAALGLLAIVVGPRLARGPVAVLAACGSGATLVALVPGVFGVVNEATGAGPIIWRLLLGPPTAVLVGLLVTWPMSTERSGLTFPRMTGSVVAVGASVVVVLGLLLSSGSVIWSTGAGARLTSSPTWKVPQGPLADVRALPATGVPRGLWLLPPQQMEVLSISSTRHSSVVPRYLYLPALQASPRAVADRRRLFALAAGIPQPVKTIRAALSRLDVAVACVPARNLRVRRILSQAVGERLEPVGSMRCHVRRS